MLTVFETHRLDSQGKRYAIMHLLKGVIGLNYYPFGVIGSLKQLNVSFLYCTLKRSTFMLYKVK